MENKRFLRIILSFVLALLACAALIYGASNLVCARILSRKSITAAVNETDLFEEYDSIAVPMVNSCIYRLTDLPLNEGPYIDESTMTSVFDETQVKKLLIDECTEYADVLTKNEETRLTAEKVLPLTEKLRTYIAEKTGRQVTDEQMLTQLNEAIMFNRMYAPAGQQTIFPGWGIVAIIAGVLMLAALMFIRRHNLLIASLYVLVALLLCTLFFFIVGEVLLRLDWLVEVRKGTEGTKLVANWVFLSQKSIRGTGIWFMVSMIVPVGVISAYLIDKNHVIKLNTIGRKRQID